MQCIIQFQNENNCNLPAVLEIGAAEGEGIARYAGFCKKVIAVDPMIVHPVIQSERRPDHFSLEKHDLKHDEQKLVEFTKNTTLRGYDVELVMKPSHWDETLKSVKELLDGSEVDILLVDGAHHPKEAVLKDFNLYSPLINQNGFLIFDDIYEPDVRYAYDIAQQSGWTVIDEWEIKEEKMLQAVGILRRDGTEIHNR